MHFGSLGLAYGRDCQHLVHGMHFLELNPRLGGILGLNASPPQIRARSCRATLRSTKTCQIPLGLSARRAYGIGPIHSQEMYASLS